MIKINTVDYNLSGIDQIIGSPTVRGLVIFQQQLVKVQTSYKNNIAEALDHEYLWIMCTSTQWRLTQNIIADIVPSIHPGLYTGNLNSLKSTYKQSLKLNKEYKEHKRNTSVTQSK